jgi:hypothetical protein
MIGTCQKAETLGVDSERKTLEAVVGPARLHCIAGSSTNTISPRITNSDAEILGQAPKQGLWDSDGANSIIGKPLSSDS